MQAKNMKLQAQPGSAAYSFQVPSAARSRQHRAARRYSTSDHLHTVPSACTQVDIDAMTKDSVATAITSQLRLRRARHEQVVIVTSTGFIDVSS
jgi:hypothetical protein